MIEALASPFGWFAFAINARGIARVTIGHPSRQAALEACCLERLAQKAVPDSVAALADRLRRQFEAYIGGCVVSFEDLPLDLSPVTPFQRLVYLHCRSIGYGTICTYRDVAVALGRERGARAVGQALRRNPFPIVVPCHRVVGAGGKLTGFTAPGGLGLKERLITFEREVVRKSRTRMDV